MIVNPHHELILLAAEMAQGTGLPSEFPEDRGFCKTTPVKERRRIIAELELSRQTARVWAQRVRAAADLLAAEVAALRQSVMFEQDRIAAFLDERESLRARLAEAEAALRRIMDGNETATPWEIAAAYLSKSDSATVTTGEPK